MNDETIEYQKIFWYSKEIDLFIKKGIYSMILWFLRIKVKFTNTKHKFVPWYCLFLHREYDLISNSTTTFAASCLIEENNIKATSNIKDNEQVDRLRRYMYVPIKYKTRVRTFVIVVLRNKNEIKRNKW